MPIIPKIMPLILANNVAVLAHLTDVSALNSFFFV